MLHPIRLLSKWFSQYDDQAPILWWRFPFRSVQAEKPGAAYRSAVDYFQIAQSSSRRLARLFGRAENEITRLKAISNRAVVLNRNTDGTQKEAYYLDSDLVNSAKQRLNVLFRNVDQELQRMNKVAERSTGDDTTTTDTDYD